MSSIGLVTLRRWVLAALALTLVVTAWVADDAYISFRTVDRFVAGEGLTWNPGERVQAFTHPLWFFLHALAAWVTGEIYYTTLVVCALCTGVTVYLLVFRLAPGPAVGALVGVALWTSRGFIDYSSSGLENPLTHVLVVVFVGWGWMSRGGAPPGAEPRRLVTMAALAALLGLNRLDLLALVFPALAVEWWHANRRAKVRAALILGLPLMVWEVFSLVYFGSPVPNTAAAKLGTGVGIPGRIVQGFYYLASCGIQDGLTVAVGGWIAVSMWRDARARPLVVGVLGYLAYLVLIGGDSMLGRFLTPPFVLLLAWAAAHPIPVPPGLNRPAVAIVGTLLAFRVGTSLLSPAVDVVGIGDERRVWYPHTGFIPSWFVQPWPEARWRTTIGTDCSAAPCTQIQNMVGLHGYFADPGVVVIDEMTLADPFRSRLPGLIAGQFNLPGRLAWRPAHVARPIPAGLLESIATGTNQIADPDLAQLYGAVQLVSRGPLWTQERWRAIWKLNTGGYHPQVARWVARHPEWYPPRGD